MGDDSSATPVAMSSVERETDRRDSGRVPIALLVRDAALGGSFEPYRGNLGLGGVFFDALHPPVGNKMELRFLLPGLKNEVQATGEVLRISREGTRFGTHVRFVEMPLDVELAIARFLQQE